MSSWYNFDKISVVIASQEKEENKKELIEHITNTSGYPVDIFFVGENTDSLTKVYQKYLDESPNDIIVYIHDDINFLKNNWGKELVDIFKTNPKFGIIGIAGTREYGTGSLAWWETSGKEKRGMLFHGDEKHSWLTSFSEYNLNSKVSEVVVIDGVFMAINRNKIEYDFDEEIEGFHFYDIDFCLANFLSHKMRIGVTDRIAIIHKSTGSLNEQWFKNGKYVYEKYKNNFPVRVFRK